MELGGRELLGGQLEHRVLGHSMLPPYPPGSRCAVFAMGCFWGAERLFWSHPGVWVTACGYCGGDVEDPTYEQVCTAATGHAESVLVVYDEVATSYEALLEVFWEGHDPTTFMRQGNDVGPQYRSAIFASDSEQLRLASASALAYQRELERCGFGAVTTEIAAAGVFYFAEPYHQQYLAKKPNGYCGLSSTGVRCQLRAEG